MLEQLAKMKKSINNFLKNEKSTQTEFTGTPSKFFKLKDKTCLTSISFDPNSIDKEDPVGLLLLGNALTTCQDLTALSFE